MATMELVSTITSTTNTCRHQGGQEDAVRELANTQGRLGSYPRVGGQCGSKPSVGPSDTCPSATPKHPWFLSPGITHHPTPADHVVHQPVDRLKGSIHSGVTACKGVVEQGAQADLAIAPALNQAAEQRWAAAPVAQEQKQAQAEAGRAQQQAPLAPHGS